MTTPRVEIILPTQRRFNLIPGVEVSDQRVLNDQLDLETGALLARVQVYPTLEGFEVETYPPDGRKIRFSPIGVAFEPPESGSSWTDLFQVRAVSPFAIVFPNRTEIQVSHGSV